MKVTVINRTFGGIIEGATVKVEYNKTTLATATADESGVADITLTSKQMRENPKVNIEVSATGFTSKSLADQKVHNNFRIGLIMETPPQDQGTGR